MRVDSDGVVNDWRFRHQPVTAVTTARLETPCLSNNVNNKFVSETVCRVAVETEQWRPARHGVLLGYPLTRRFRELLQEV
jgi:hypothetical protein